MSRDASVHGATAWIPYWESITIVHVSPVRVNTSTNRILPHFKLLPGRQLRIRNDVTALAGSPDLTNDELILNPGREVRYYLPRRQNL